MTQDPLLRKLTAGLALSRKSVFAPCHFCLPLFRRTRPGGTGKVKVARGRLVRRQSDHSRPLRSRFLRRFFLEEASMPRRPKPFFHRGWWVTNTGGTRTKLAQGRENKDAAEDALLDLLNELRRNPVRKTYPQLTVRDLCDKFLDWVEIHRAPDTYEDYHDGLAGWVKLHGNRRARDIHSLDLEEWKGKLVKKGLANCTVNHAVIPVKVCWSWAVKQEPPLLPSNPLKNV